MLKSTLNLLLLSSLMFAVGCADDDDDGGGGNNDLVFSPKPLPPCLDTIDIDLRWGEDPRAYMYKIAVGFQPGSHAWSINLDTPRDSFKLEGMDRDAHYYIQVTRESDMGQNKTESADIEIPSCEDRDDYQKAHPKYSEPIILEFDWGLN